MKQLTNERGGAFVLTLMTMTVLLVFVSVLLTQSMTVTKQVHTTSKQIDARLIAEMGVTYYEATITQLVNQDSLHAHGSIAPIENEPYVIDDKRSFVIKNVTEKTDGSNIIINFTSVGIVGKTEVAIEHTIVIEMGVTIPNEKGDTVS